jgi:hypothetical protein
MEGPMLLPPNALASGPQACFSTEKRIAKVKVSKGNRGFDSPRRKE